MSFFTGKSKEESLLPRDRSHYGLCFGFKTAAATRRVLDLLMKFQLNPAIETISQARNLVKESWQEISFFAMIRFKDPWSRCRLRGLAFGKIRKKLSNESFICIWRRKRESNPRRLSPLPVFETGPFGHLGISPCAFLLYKILFKKSSPKWKEMQKNSKAFKMTMNRFPSHSDHFIEDR